MAMAQETPSTSKADESMAIEDYKEEVKKYLTKVIFQQSVEDVKSPGVKIEIRFQWVFRIKSEPGSAHKNTPPQKRLVNISIKRNDREEVLIEPFMSTGTVRVSIKLYANADQEEIFSNYIICKAKCSGAEFVYRREYPLEGYDITIDFTNLNTQHGNEFVALILYFIQKMEDVKERAALNK